jgi:hypothetical protein
MINTCYPHHRTALHQAEGGYPLLHLLNRVLDRRILHCLLARKPAILVVVIRTDAASNIVVSLPRSTSATVTADHILDESNEASLGQKIHRELIQSASDFRHINHKLFHRHLIPHASPFDE